MYTALKSAQNEINETLLKLVDRMQAMASPIAQPMFQPVPVPVASPMPVPVAQPMPVNDYSEDFNRLNSTLEYVNQKQNSQFQAIIQELKNVNQSLANLMNVMILQSQNSVNTSTTIPSLQPVAQESDLKEVHIVQEQVGELPDQDDQDQDDQDQEIQVDDDQDDQDDQEVHLEDQDDQEVQVDDDQDQEVQLDDQDQEEEGLEVEEWTFKGRSFFKDTENTVYKNDNGEVGDPMGIYDPVKNVIKSLPNK